MGAGSGGTPGARPPVCARGILKFVILKLLAEQPRHGYDLMRFRAKGWAGGAGSVYPLLAALEAAGLIVGRDEGDRRIYEVTEKGRRHLGEHAGRPRARSSKKKGTTRAGRAGRATARFGRPADAGGRAAGAVFETRNHRARSRVARSNPQRNLPTAGRGVTLDGAGSGGAAPGVNVFEEGKPMWQILLVFLVPLMLSNVLQSASQTMASIWIGRLISTQALGAVSAVFPIIFLLFSFVFGVSSGSSVLDRAGVWRARPSQGEEDRRHGARRRALSRHHRRRRRSARIADHALRGSRRRPTSSRKPTPTPGSSF